MWIPPQWFVDSLLSLTGLALIAFLISKRVFEYGKLVAELNQIELDRRLTQLEIRKLTMENEFLMKRSGLEMEKLELELKELRAKASAVAVSRDELDRILRLERRRIPLGDDANKAGSSLEESVSMFSGLMKLVTLWGGLERVESVLLGLLAAALLLTLISRIL
jgi:hypothetical protein